MAQNGRANSENFVWNFLCPISINSPTRFARRRIKSFASLARTNQGEVWKSLVGSDSLFCEFGFDKLTKELNWAAKHLWQNRMAKSDQVKNGWHKACFPKKKHLPFFSSLLLILLFNCDKMWSKHFKWRRNYFSWISLCTQRKIFFLFIFQRKFLWISKIIKI